MQTKTKNSTKSTGLNSLDAVLKSAKKVEKKSKVYDYPEVVDSVDEIAFWRQRKEEAETTGKVIESELVEQVKAFYCEQTKTRDFRSSVRVQGQKNNALVAYSNWYSKIPVEDEKRLKAITGEKFGKCFRTVNKIKVKEDISKTELEELIKKVGPQEFARFFEVTQSISPTLYFTQNRYAVLSKEQNEKLEEFCKQRISIRIEKKEVKS